MTEHSKKPETKLEGGLIEMEMYMKIKIDGTDKEVADAWKSVMKAIHLTEANEGATINCTSSPVDYWDTEKVINMEYTKEED